MSFNAIRENNTRAKISEFTVPVSSSNFLRIFFLHHFDQKMFCTFRKYFLSEFVSAVYTLAFVISNFMAGWLPKVATFMRLTLCPLENCSYFFVVCILFSKSTFSKNYFRNTKLCVKQFGSRSGQKICRA